MHDQSIRDGNEKEYIELNITKKKKTKCLWHHHQQTSLCCIRMEIGIAVDCLAN
jgi:hypothetical protein